MAAFIVLLLAALTRFVPHTLHGVGMNFTAVGGSLLYFGARRPRWQAAIAAAVMAITDVILTTQVYNRPFHVRGYVVTWLWYAAVCLVGSALLRKVTALRVAASVFASATGFFLIVDFVLWAGGHFYAHTAAGLMQCYVAALPFYGNDLVSTGLTATVLFGLPVAAAKLVESWQQVQNNNQPLM
jgi:hypothetical protein